MNDHQTLTPRLAVATRFPSALTPHMCTQLGKPSKTGRTGTSTTIPWWLLDKQPGFRLTLVPERVLLRALAGISASSQASATLVSSQG